MTRNSVLSALSGVLAVGAVLASLPVAADAATGGSYIYYNTEIYANGQQISQPKHIATRDWFGGPNGAVTSFLPFYYTDQALADMGIKTTWNGTNGILNLQVPAGTTVNYPTNVTPVAITPNTMAIQINGRAVTFAPRIAYFDAGTNITTSFIPVYYLQKALSYAGITANWNGADWTMVSQSQTSNGTGGATKLQAALDFAQALGIKTAPSGQNPYSDVSSADSSVISKLSSDFHYAVPDSFGETIDTGSSLFQPDSSSKFGANDPITTQQIDYAYMVYSGIKPSQMQNLPGGATGMANLIGLNKGLPSSGVLSSADLQTMTKNLETLQKGYTDLGSGKYQLVYCPTPEIASGFNGGISQSKWQSDVSQIVKEYDASTVTVGNGVVITSIPGLNDAGYNTTSGNFPVIDGNGGASITSSEYSLDGGKLWQTAQSAYGYSSLDPANGGTSNPPSEVLLRNSQGSSVEYGYLFNGSWYTFASEIATGTATGGLLIQ